MRVLNLFLIWLYKFTQANLDFMLEVGLLVLLGVFGMAFWILIFLASYIPVWIGMGVAQMMKAKMGTTKDVFEEIEA